MLKLEVFPNRFKFIGDYPKDHVDEVTSVYVPGYNFVPAFRNGSWDGKVHHLKRDTAPTGLLPVVLELLTMRKVPFDIEYKYHPVTKPHYTVPTTFKGFPLYPHQTEAIDTFLNQGKELPFRGVFHIATGGGKTACAALIAREMNVKTLFVVHGKNLSKQNYEVFKEVFKDNPEALGFVTADEWNPSKVTVSSIDTLYRRLKNKDKRVKDLLAGVALLVADECHRGTSASFETVMRDSMAPFRLGLSGTPLKKEASKDLLLQALIGPVIYSKNIASLQEENLVSAAQLHAIHIDYPKNVDLGYADAMSDLIFNNFYRNNVVAKVIEQKIAEGKTGLVICGNSVVLTKNVYNSLHGKYSENVVRMCYGKTDFDYNEESFELLRQKKLNFVIVSSISDEGIDIPDIDCLIVAASGRSYVKTIQRIGRGLRLKKDGGSLEVWEFLDSTNPYLKKHSTKRMSYYNGENFFSDIANYKCSDILPYPIADNKRELIDEEEDNEADDGF